MKPNDKLKLAPGTTMEDILDCLDEAVVTYMAMRRLIDEAGMRKLLETDAEVKASYDRKIARTIKMLKDSGSCVAVASPFPTSKAKPNAEPRKGT